jgi:hypothetical protein
MTICICACPTTLADTTETKGDANYTLPHDTNASDGEIIDFSAFSKLLASALVLREGAISNATRALPYLSAVTHHYLNTQVQPFSFSLTLLKLN